MALGRTSTLYHWTEMLLAFFLVVLVLILPFEKRTAGILNTALYGALGLVVILALARRTTTRIPTPLDLPILALVVIAVLSTLFSIDPLISLKSIHRTLIQFLLVYYVVVYAVNSIERVKLLAFTFLAGSVPVSLYGIFTFFSKKELIDGRIHSTFYHPTRLANYLLFVVAISVLLGAHYRSRKTLQKLLYAVFGLGSLCLVLTTSRGATLSLLLGFLVVFGPRKKWLWLMLTVIIATSIAIVPFQSKHLRFMKVAECFSKKVDANMVLGERICLWQSAMRMIKDHPVLGLGYGKTFNLLYKSCYAERGTTQDHSSAHNILLEVALEMGPLGLVVFLWLHILIFVETFRLVRHHLEPSTFARALAAGILIGLIGVTFNGMANYFYRDRLILIYWLFVGIVFSLRRISSRDPVAEPASQKGSAG